MQEVLDKLQALRDAVEETKTRVAEAMNQASEAENAASEAKSQADYAEDYAMEARKEADRADDELAEHLDTIDAIADMIRTEVPEVSTEKSLKADIARWKGKVTPLLANGHSHDAIASHLGISEFLVQCIKDDVARAA